MQIILKRAASHFFFFFACLVSISLITMALPKAKPFQLQEIVENILEYLHSWQDCYSFATTCKDLYTITINCRIDLPWILQPEDLDNKCILPKETARFLVLFREIINTPMNIKKTIPSVLATFSFTSNIIMSDSTLLSNNCVRHLLIELSKSNRQINMYIDKKVEVSWKNIYHNMKKKRVNRKINLFVYNEVYICYLNETLNGWTPHQILMLFTYFLEHKSRV